MQWYTQARYDIAYEVSRIAQYCAKPTQGAMKALRRLLGYMNTTKHRQLMVPRVWGNEWHMYSDSDHAGEAGAGICIVILIMQVKQVQVIAGHTQG